MNNEDSIYNERNRCVALIASLAISKGWKAGLAKTDIEGWDPEWHNCVYIDLPTGQASWHFHDRELPLFSHLPAYDGEWDGHTTEQKYGRLEDALSLLMRPREPGDESCPQCGDPDFADPETKTFVTVNGGSYAAGAEPTVHWSEGWIVCRECGHTEWGGDST